MHMFFSVAFLKYKIFVRIIGIRKKILGDLSFYYKAEHLFTTFR